MSHAAGVARRQSFVVESLEARSLLSAYFVDSDADLAYINTLNFAAGDQVLLRGGQTFSGWLHLDARYRGTAANPIRIGSYDPDTGAAIASDADADARATIQSGTGVGIWIQNTAGIHISGLNLVGDGSAVNTANGIYASNTLPGNRKLARLHLDHLDVSGYGQSGIAIGGEVGKSGFSNVRITHSDVHDNAMTGIMMWGNSRRGSLGYSHKNIYVGYVNAYQNTGIANFHKHTGSGIIVGGVNGAMIEHSTASYNGALNTAEGGPVGIWAYDANKVVIQYNESHHQTNSAVDGGGFDLDGGVTNSVMQYNYSHDNDGSGYGLYQYAGARPWRNNVVQFNVSENDARKNHYGAIDIWSAGSKMMKASIHSNTVIIDSDGADGTPWAVRVSTTMLAGVKLFNNTFTTKNDAGLIWAETALKPAAVQFQYNTYTADSFNISWGVSGYSSLIGWQDFDRQERLPNGQRVGFVNPPTT
jgi:hypothetical protein